MSGSVVLEQFPFSNRRTATENIRAKKQRIYIMPTRHGVLFGLMLLAMLLGAVNYNNSMAFILTFLLFSLMLVTILHTCKNLAGLVINEAPPTPVFSGELAKFPLILDNRNDHLRFSIYFVRVPKKWRLFTIAKKLNNMDAPTVPCDAMANEFCRVELPIKATHRGMLKAGRVKVYTMFPLGLFKAWSYIDIQQSCIVYPKPAGQKPFPPFKLTEATGIQGNTSGTDDFIGFRNYRAGDSIKDIAWKAYAQQKGLFVKRFSGCGSDKLHLNWNDVAHLPEIEARLSLLCHWIIEAELQSLLYSLEIPGIYIDIGHGEEHLHLCLSSLAKYGLNDDNLKN